MLLMTSHRLRVFCGKVLRSGILCINFKERNFLIAVDTFSWKLLRVLMSEGLSHAYFKIIFSIEKIYMTRKKHPWRMHNDLASQNWCRNPTNHVKNICKDSDLPLMEWVRLDGGQGSESQGLASSSQGDQAGTLWYHSCQSEILWEMWRKLKFTKELSTV